MIPLLKLDNLSQRVFHPPIGMLDFMRLLLFGCLRGGFQLRSSNRQRMEFISVAFGNVGGTLPQLGFETSPIVLPSVLLLLQKQAEGFFGAQLGDSGEVLYAEPI